MKFLCANRIAPDGTPHSVASHLCLCPTKGTPGLNELKGILIQNHNNLNIYRIFRITTKTKEIFVLLLITNGQTDNRVLGLIKMGGEDGQNMVEVIS